MATEVRAEETPLEYRDGEGTLLFTVSPDGSVDFAPTCTVRGLERVVAAWARGAGPEWTGDVVLVAGYEAVDVTQAIVHRYPSLARWSPVLYRVTPGYGVEWVYPVGEVVLDPGAAWLTGSGVQVSRPVAGLLGLAREVWWLRARTLGAVSLLRGVPRRFPDVATLSLLLAREILWRRGRIVESVAWAHGREKTSPETL